MDALHGVLAFGKRLRGTLGEASMHVREVGRACLRHTAGTVILARSRTAAVGARDNIGAPTEYPRNPAGSFRPGSAHPAIAAHKRKVNGAGVTAAPFGPAATLERVRPSFRRGESRRNPGIIASRNDTAMTQLPTCVTRTPPAACCRAAAGGPARSCACRTGNRLAL